jgi:ferrochelatase
MNHFCVILLGMGGPETIGDVKQYLYNIFSDRSLIQLPGGRLLQKPFARLISQVRHQKVRENYRIIGGGSPILKWTDSQRDHLVEMLTPLFPHFDCYVGMRYFPPMIENAVLEAYVIGYRTMYFLPMYPQYCRATTGSSFTAAREALSRCKKDVRAEFIDDFHDFPEYIALLQEYIESNIRDDDTLLFSAHAIPQKLVDEGDPYYDQVQKTAALAAGGREYYLAFQSRTGPVNWIGPDTVEEVRRLLREKPGGIFIAPLSFVCDHIETLYELDHELPEDFPVEDAVRIRRMPMFNDDPRFGRVLADLIIERMAAHGA